MAILKCKDCGKDVSESAPSCPHCGRVPEKRRQSVNAGQVFGVLLAGALLFWWFGVAGSERDPVTTSTMDNIYGKVSSDAVAQYGIAKRNGNAMDACVQAGIVAAAFLQSKDEANYAKWKATEKDDCKLAGLSR